MNSTGSGDKLRRIASTTVHQLDLYRQLVGVEWKEEKLRLFGMIVSLLLGLAFFFCLLVGLSSMAIILSWDTQHRNLVMIGLVLFYGLGLFLAWYRFTQLHSRASQAFSDTREELAVDIELLRNKVDR